MDNQHRWDTFINHLINTPAGKPRSARDNAESPMSDSGWVDPVSSDGDEPWREKDPKFFDKSGKSSSIICATCGSIIHDVNLHVQWHQRHGDLP